MSKNVVLEEDIYVKLDFSKEKGGISGNRQQTFDEYLNVVSDIPIVLKNQYKSKKLF